MIKAAFPFCVLVFILGCGQSDRKQNSTEHLGGRTLAETIADNRPHLLSIPGVLKVEEGDCGIDSCIKVFVAKKTAILTAQIPHMLETWQVDVVEAAK